MIWECENRMTEKGFLGSFQGFWLLDQKSPQYNQKLLFYWKKASPGFFDDFGDLQKTSSSPLSEQPNSNCRWRVCRGALTEVFWEGGEGACVEIFSKFSARPLSYYCYGIVQYLRTCTDNNKNLHERDWTPLKDQKFWDFFGLREKLELQGFA